MAIYFFDKNQTLIKIVPESATFEAIQTQELDDDSLLKDTISVTIKGDEKLLNAEYMAVKSYTGNAQTFDMYRIVTDTTPDKSMSFTGMGLAPYELNGHILQDLRPTNQTISYTLNRILDGTDWRVGYIEDGLSNVTTTFYYVSAKEALKELQSLVGCEFVFKVEISGQKITDKWIEVYKEMGNRTKKRFNYGTNALTVVRETNKADIFTALIGRGKGEEVTSADENESGQAGYGRKITFEDIEWSIAKGNPLDKPKGQYYLELPQATQAYGIKNIDGTMKARVGIVDFDDEEDKNRLINLTYQQLLVSSRPKVLFKTTVANVGATGIGDTVTIHRHDLNIHYQTRVRKIVRNKLNDNKTQIELGDAVVTASTKQAKQNNATIKNLNQEIEKVKVDVTTSQTSADGKNTIFYGSEEPDVKRTGDTWYRPHPSIAGETQMLVWNGTAWELVIDTSDLTSVSRAVEEAAGVADEAKQTADNAIKQIDTAVTNAGFTSLDDTFQNINRITTRAEQNAQQAITNASNAYGLAQTSISEAQTAQANSLAALGKADNALDGVSNLDIRVDDVESELELKADNTFMTEDGTLTTLSNAITFNANRFSSDMSRIESRVESLAGEINLVILRDAIEGRYIARGDSYPNPTGVGNRDTMHELIEVEAGEQLAVSKETVDGSENNMEVVFYTTSLLENYYSSQAANERIITVPAGSKYLWVSYPKGSKPQIIRGSEFLPYRPNLVDQLTSDEMVIFRNEYDEYADRTERRLTAIDSKGGSLDVLSNEIITTADSVTKAMTSLIDTKVDSGEFSEFYQNEYLETAKEVSRKISLSDVKVGTRNLLKGTTDFTGLWGGLSMWRIEPDKYEGLTVYSGNHQFNGIWTEANVKKDVTYTFSAYVRVNTIDTPLGFFLAKDGNQSDLSPSQELFDMPYVPVGEMKRISFTFTALEDTVIRPRIEKTTDTSERLWVAGYKLETGNVATDYTPAPEDTDQSINHIETEWTQTFDTFSQTVSGIDGRVTAQKQTIDSISSTVSGHGNRLSTVEQTASGLQTTVASKASQSQVTQLANGLNSVVTNQSNLVLNPYFEGGRLDYWTGLTYVGNTDKSQSTREYYSYSSRRDIYNTNYIAVEPGEVLYVSMHAWASFPSNRITLGLRYFDMDKNHLGWSDRSVSKLNGTSSTFGGELTVPNGARFAHVWVNQNVFDNFDTWFFTDVKVTRTPDYNKVNSQISQLANNINLRVSKGELLSQINVQAGGVLIQSGTNKLNITPETTYIQDATIKSAMIASLEADKITTGTFDASKAKIINLDANNITTGSLKSINIVNTISYPSDGRTYTGDMTIAGGQISSYVTAGTDYYKSIFINDRNIRLSNQNATLNMQAGRITFDGTMTGGGQIWYQDNLARLIAGSYNGFALASYRDGKFSNRISVGGWPGEELAPFVDIHTTLNMRYRTIENVNAMSLKTDVGKTGAKIYATGDNNLALGGTWGTVIGHLGSDGVTVYEFLKADQASDRVRFSKNINMAGNTILNQSDERLKHNIYDLERDDLSILKDIRYKNFTFNNQDKETFGFIAQDLQKLMPSMIMEETDGYLSYDSMEYTHFIGHALQQLDSKVDDKVEQLEAKIASLQDELATLKGA